MLQNTQLELPNQYYKMVEQLYSEHKTTMICVAMKIVRNKEHAYDIVHSSFVSVIKHAKKLSTMSTKQVKGYLILTVRNRALDFTRLHENKYTVPLENYTGIVEYSSAEKEAILNIQIHDIMLYIDKMDSKYSIPVFNKYVLGFSMSEIASMLNISVANAKVRCTRGRAKLLELIKAGKTDE